MVAIFLGFQIGNSFFASQMGTEQEEMEIYEAEPEAEDTEKTNQESSSSQEANQTSEEPVIDDSEENDERDEASSETDSANVGFYVQVGAFGNGDNASNLLEDLENRGFQVRIEGSEPYRVQVVGGDTRDDAEEIASELQGLGFETLIISQ